MRRQETQIVQSCRTSDLDGALSGFRPQVIRSPVLREVQQDQDALAARLGLVIRVRFSVVDHRSL